MAKEIAPSSSTEESSESEYSSSSDDEAPRTMPLAPPKPAKVPTSSQPPESSSSSDDEKGDDDGDSSGSESESESESEKAPSATPAVNKKEPASSNPSKTQLKTKKDDTLFKEPKPVLNKEPKPVLKQSEEEPSKDKGTTAKKTGWDSEDEMKFYKELLKYCKENNGLPKNYSAFYDVARGSLQGEYNSRQLYEKIRRGRERYKSISAKESKGLQPVLKDNEEEFYKIAKQIWNEEDSTATETETKKGTEKKVKRKSVSVPDNAGTEGMKKKKEASVPDNTGTEDTKKKKEDTVKTEAATKKEKQTESKAKKTADNDAHHDADTAVGKNQGGNSKADKKGKNKEKKDAEKAVSEKQADKQDENLRDKTNAKENQTESKKRKPLDPNNNDANAKKPKTNAVDLKKSGVAKSQGVQQVNGNNQEMGSILKNLNEQLSKISNNLLEAGERCTTVIQETVSKFNDRLTSIRTEGLFNGLGNLEPVVTGSSLFPKLNIEESERFKNGLRNLRVQELRLQSQRLKLIQIECDDNADQLEAGHKKDD